MLKLWMRLGAAVCVLGWVSSAAIVSFRVYLLVGKLCTNNQKGSIYSGWNGTVSPAITAHLPLAGVVLSLPSLCLHFPPTSWGAREGAFQFTPCTCSKVHSLAGSTAPHSSSPPPPTPPSCTGLNCIFGAWLQCWVLGSIWLRLKYSLLALLSYSRRWQ